MAPHNNPHIVSITVQIVDGDFIGDPEINDVVGGILATTHVEGWCVYDSVTVQVERETSIVSWAQKLTERQVENEDGLYDQPPVQVYE